MCVDPATVEHYIRQYMDEDWESISVLGEYSRGLEAVLQLVNTTLTAFPDLRLHILDSFCEGEDRCEFKEGTYYRFYTLNMHINMVCPPENGLVCKNLHKWAVITIRIFAE